MASRVEKVADDLQGKAGKRGSIDLIQDYALPIPVSIISDMLGIPARDQLRFHRWSNRIVAVSASKSILGVLPSLLRFLYYLRRLIAAKRAEPGDDLISALIEAEEASNRLSADEVLAMVFLLVVADHETTVNLIGNGTLALLQFPSECERLRSDPSPFRSAVEELLRFYSPVEVATERYAREPIEIEGVTIPPETRSSVPCSRPRIATKPASKGRTFWISAGRTMVTSPSETGCTSVSALPSPGSRAASLSSECSPTGPTSGWRLRPTISASAPAST